MEEKRQSIRADDYKKYYVYICPYCGQKIITLIKAYPDDWLRCKHCYKNIKVIDAD